MKKWLETNAKALQGLAAVVTMLAAVAALVGVKLQIDATQRQQREQSARDIYREYLSLSIARPDLSNPDYCALAEGNNAAAYDDYVGYLLYTSEQILAAMPDWEPVLAAQLRPHRELLCGNAGWYDEESQQVRRMILRFRTEQCQAFVSACPKP